MKKDLIIKIVVHLLFLSVIIPSFFWLVNNISDIFENKILSIISYNMGVICLAISSYCFGKFYNFIYSKFTKKSLKQRFQKVLKRYQKSKKKISSLNDRKDALNSILIKENHKMTSIEKEYEELSEEIKQLYPRPEEIFGLKR